MFARPLVPLALAALLLAAIPLTCRNVPRLLGTAEGERSTPEQRRALRKIATAAVKRYEAQYGELALDQWPEQARATYRTARQYLDEIEAGGDGLPPTGAPRPALGTGAKKTNCVPFLSSRTR